MYLGNFLILELAKLNEKARVAQEQAEILQNEANKINKKVDEKENELKKKYEEED